MAKFFVVSDIHGYFDAFLSSLKKAGWDSENPDHYIISCGDNWDRGKKNTDVFHFLNLAPRTILIRGNHESLFEECCNRGYPQNHDISNGTYGTIMELGDPLHQDKPFNESSIYAMNRVELFLKKMVDYFETEKYIFVHGYIPVITEDLPVYYTRNRTYQKDYLWRNSHYVDWEQARWLNGIDMAMKYKILEDNKTIVFGHWHCSYAHSLAENTPEFGEGSNFDPYYGDGFIAIDGCTAYSGQVNVIVLEDNFITKDGVNNE